MQTYRYKRAAHHQPGVTEIVLEFERPDGGNFQIALPIHDDEQLRNDLQREINIAQQKP